MRVALVYDRVNKFGGAERLILALHRLYPQAPLYTLVYHRPTASWASDFKVIPTFFNRAKFVRRRHEILAPLAALGFETLNFDQFDLVISITSESAKAIITKPQTLHLCYCLTPTRYLWSSAKEYKSYPLLGHFLSPFTKSLQKKDKILSYRPDHYLTISKTAQRRIKKYYHQDADVIHPPIDYSFWSQKGKDYTSDSSGPEGTLRRNIRGKRGGEGKISPDIPSQRASSYYLLVSRLVPYKKTDLVVRTFNYLGQLPSPPRLKIVGIGSQQKSLRRLAGSNVEFLGSVSDSRLRSLYQNALAVIFPQDEDFGLVPLEAQAAGTPVLAFGRGGALETIISGQTGLFFAHQTPQSLISALHRFESKHRLFTPARCRQNAARFSHNRFTTQFSAKVDWLWQKHRAQSI